jgi:hypothetical protein
VSPATPKKSARMLLSTPWISSPGWRSSSPPRFRSARLIRHQHLLHCCSVPGYGPRTHEMTARWNTNRPHPYVQVRASSKDAPA